MAFEALQSIVDGMDAGTWTQIPNTNPKIAGEEGRGGCHTLIEIRAIEDANPGCVNMWGLSGSSSIFNAEGGAAFDGKKMYFIGGGHFDYGGNGIYSFDFSLSANLENGWTREFEPSPLTVPFPNTDGTIHDYCKMAEDGPQPAHTWSQFTYNAANNSLVHTGGDTLGFGVAPEDEPTLPNCYHPKTELGLMWEYLLDTGVWQSFTGPNPDSDNNDFGTGVYYPVNQEVIQWNKKAWGDDTEGPWAFDTLGAMVRRGLTKPISGAPFAMVYNPNDTFCYLSDSRTNSIQKWNPSTVPLARNVQDMLYVPQELLDQSPLDSYNWAEGGLAIDNTRNTILLWTGIRQTWLYDVAQNTITQHANESSVIYPTSSQRHIYTKWKYIPEVDAYVGLMTGQEDIWVYKLDGVTGGIPNTKMSLRTKPASDELQVGYKYQTKSLDNSPIVVSQNFTGVETPLAIQSPGLLEGAIYGTVQIITIVQPDNGNIYDINLDGSFSVSTTAPLPETIVFDFSITDENGTSNLAQVEVIINPTLWTATKKLSVSGITVDRIVI